MAKVLVIKALSCLITAISGRKTQPSPSFYPFFPCQEEMPKAESLGDRDGEEAQKLGLLIYYLLLWGYIMFGKVLTLTKVLSGSD